MSSKLKTGGDGRGTRSDQRKKVSGPERERLRKRIHLAIQASPYRNVELGAKLGICPSSISHWLGGGALPGLDMVAPLASALGVSPGWFWTTDPPPVWEQPRPILAAPIDNTLRAVADREGDACTP